jgi:hypothetical protein
MHTAEYQRGYDAGYKQALLDAIRKGGPPTELEPVEPRPRPRPPFHPGAERRILHQRLGDTSNPAVQERLRRHGLWPK